MLGGTVNKIVNTQFKWSGTEQGMTGMQKLSAGAAAAGAAVIAAGAALWRLADQTTRTFGAFEDMSQRTGIAASELHALSIAAEQTSSDFEAITTGLRRMPSFLEDARNGMASATTAMDVLGVSMQDFEGLSPEDSFYRMIDALGSVEDETRRAALAQDVFGRGAMALIPLIESGSGELRGFADEARRTGLVLDEDAYAAADRFQDAIAMMNREMQSALMEGIEPLLPQLQQTAETLMGIAAEAIPQLIQALGAALPAIETFGNLLSKSLEGWTMIMQGGAGWNPLNGQFDPRFDMQAVIDAQAEAMTIDPGFNRDAMRIAQGHDRLAIEAEIADKQAAYVASLETEAEIIGGSGGGGGGGTDSILAAEQARNDLLDYRMQILEKTQALEERQAEAAAEALQAQLDAQAAIEQAEYDARLERLQGYADLTTQIMGAAWDSFFGNTRQSFGDMLKDMTMDLVKSGILGLLRKGIMGGATGGLGFFF
jgi:hypothetical protein